jgi:hypothetical protein
VIADNPGVATLVLRTVSPEDINCDNCPLGAAIALTVFLPGVGNGLDGSGRLDYVNPELVDPDTGQPGFNAIEAFLGKLVERFQAGSEQAQEEPCAAVCCQRWLYEASYDPGESARQNARSLRQMIETILQTMAGLRYVTKVYLHLVGFSAGGFVALNVAEEMMTCRVERRVAPLWCGRDLGGDFIPVEVDVVTIASPFGNDFGPLGIDPPVLNTIFEFFVGLTRPVIGPALQFFGVFHPFGYSLAENDYGGAPSPCACEDASKLVALVSAEEVGGSAEKGDPYAGDRDPTADHRLEQWRPAVVDLDGQLDDHTHDLLPLAILAKPELAKYLDPGCACVEVPPAPAAIGQ